MRKVLFFFFFLLVIAPSGWLLFNEFERKAPEVTVALPSPYLKRSYEVNITLTEQGTGLREVEIAIAQGNRRKVLLQERFPFMGYQALLMGPRTETRTLSAPVESWKYGMKDGEAVISVSARDYSWNGWNKGNSVYIEKNVIIDTVPPRIEVLTQTHNISRGGAGLAVYRLFEKGVTSGIQVGNNFFPGHSGLFDDPDIHAAFFALSYQQGPGTEIFVTASDPAGNPAKRGFYHYIKEKRFKKDTLTISDGFLARKMPEFSLEEQEARFADAADPDLQKFLYINRQLRKANNAEILQAVGKSRPEKMWSGRFLRLPGSANRANFADHRTYRYKGKTVDKQVHLGIDLASVTNAKVPAANTGVVLKTGNVGIFGNVVVIDHGFGLASIYSHLSSILVKEGTPVKKGDIIGYTGATGMAGGDHLHFGMAVHNTFVNPLEWWDTAWIKNNITGKIQRIQSQP